MALRVRSALKYIPKQILLNFHSCQVRFRTGSYSTHIWNYFNCFNKRESLNSVFVFMLSSWNALLVFIHCLWKKYHKYRNCTTMFGKVIPHIPEGVWNLQHLRSITYWTQPSEEPYFRKLEHWYFTVTININQVLFFFAQKDKHIEKMAIFFKIWNSF